MEHPSPVYYLEHCPTWATAYQTWQAELIFPMRRVGYSLRDLTERGLINRFMFDVFCASTGLAVFSWSLIWADTDNLPDEQSVPNALRTAEGILIFIHGWDRSGAVWEDWPARILTQ